MSSTWGLLANDGFQGKRVKSVYFFAGNWRSPANPRPFYEGVQVAPNDDKYTIHPVDPRHLGWSESRANRDFALDAMIAAGANVITMSYWGEPGSDRWAFWAPMQTATQAHDELFDAAVGKPILIMPAIESANSTQGCGGHSPAYHFAADFPGSALDPAPQLVSQIIDLVHRYLVAPRDPEWPGKWARLFDQAGNERFAINIIHVASHRIGANQHREFAAGFDAVARKVFEATRVRVGFTLDLLPKPHEVATQECGGYRSGGWFAIHPETTSASGGAVTAVWANDQHLDLFTVDHEGVVQSIWWDEAAGGYRPDGWFAIHPETRAAAGGAVTAVWANDKHLDLFITDHEGVVQSIWWDEAAGGYRPDGWFPIHSATKSAAGGAVTAVWANDQHLDLFMAGADGAVWSIWWDATERDGYRAAGWFRIHPEMPTRPGAAVTAVWARPSHLDLFMTNTAGAIQSTWWTTDTVEDTYVADPETLGPFLRRQESMLAVQAFLSEIWLGEVTEANRIDFKRIYLQGWAAQRIPVIMDVCPGYDGHIVFDNENVYGNNASWRNRLAALWSPSFTGITFNSWNGYTEGTAAVATVEYGNDAYLWLQRLFRMA